MIMSKCAPVLKKDRINGKLLRNSYHEFGGIWMMTEKQFQILAIISENGRVEVARLAEMLGVSQVTIRKNLDVLESRRLIRRQQGIAELDSEDDVTNRLAYHHREKLAIAMEAVKEIKNGETVMIESGSCCTLLAEQIVKQLKDVTIITNSVYMADHIRPALGNHVILLGGEIQMEPMVTVGPIMVQAAGNFYVDKFYTGVDGFTPDGYFTASDIMRVESIRTMAKQARKTIVLTESEKFAYHGVMALLPSSSIHALYTDTMLPKEVAEYLEKSGVVVHAVDMEHVTAT